MLFSRCSWLSLFGSTPRVFATAVAGVVLDPRPRSLVSTVLDSVVAGADEAGGRPDAGRGGGVMQDLAQVHNFS